MRPKPKPKEISAVVVKTTYGPSLLVVYETSDAREFAEGLSVFGELQAVPGKDNAKLLYVSITYDWQEVMDYINSYNDGE